MYTTSLLLLALIEAIVSELIPRELLFSSPRYSGVSLSPDGHLIGYLALDSNGVRNVFIKCVTCKYTDVVTFEREHIAG